MRRRSDDDADTWRVLFAILKECRKLELPSLAPLVLSYIGMQPDSSAGFAGIKEELGLSKAQTTRLTVALLEAGLIDASMAVEDRRRTVFRVTAKGRSVVGK